MVKEKTLVDTFWDTLYQKNAITRDVKIKLILDGPVPTHLYKLPIIHKAWVDTLPKYRPIISQIGSPTYKIEKYLLDLYHLLLKKNQPSKILLSLRPWLINKIIILSCAVFTSSLCSQIVHKFFSFNGSYYKELDDVAMEFLLGPALSNAFLCHHERNCLRNWCSDFLQALCGWYFCSAKVWKPC